VTRPSLDDAQDVAVRALQDWTARAIFGGGEWLALLDVAPAGGDRYDRGVVFTLSNDRTGERREFQISITSETEEGRTTDD
jgi:hypothetical protein